MIDVIDNWLLISDELRRDKEIALSMVKKDGNALEFVDSELKNDEEVVMAAIKQNEYSYKYASTFIQEKLGYKNDITASAALVDGKRDSNFYDMF